MIKIHVWEYYRAPHTEHRPAHTASHNVKYASVLLMLAGCAETCSWSHS